MWFGPVMAQHLIVVAYARGRPYVLRPVIKQRKEKTSIPKSSSRIYP